MAKMQEALTAKTSGASANAPAPAPAPAPAEPTGAASDASGPDATTMKLSFEVQVSYAWFSQGNSLPFIEAVAEDVAAATQFDAESSKDVARKKKAFVVVHSVTEKMPGFVHVEVGMFPAETPGGSKTPLEIVTARFGGAGSGPAPAAPAAALQNTSATKEAESALFVELTEPAGAGAGSAADAPKIAFPEGPAIDMPTVTSVYAHPGIVLKAALVQKRLVGKYCMVHAYHS